MPTISDKLRLFDGSTLKLMALISMIIDHIGAGVLYYMYIYELYPGWMTRELLLKLYYLTRGIGRSSFPIYCFLLTEGFVHTRNYLKYLGRLLAFAVISEPFFDILFFTKRDLLETDLLVVLRNNRDVFMQHSNVFVTLSIGLVMLWFLDCIKRHLPDNLPVTAALWAIVITACCLLAEYLCSDYGYNGICLIGTPPKEPIPQTMYDLTPSSVAKKLSNDTTELAM